MQFSSLDFSVFICKMESRLILGWESLLVRVSLAQSCLTLCDPLDWSPPGSSIHGIFQARILEWVALSYSRGQTVYERR